MWLQTTPHEVEITGSNLFIPLPLDQTLTHPKPKKY